MLNLPCNKYECYMSRCYVINNISIEESVQPQVQDIVEGRPFNISLLRL